ncbi:MAG: helix-turn-helix transcriptional regulator [Asgard group archaeon]|nr:helix-turn-helix transcriptional regulator [Asgard group archaeon]
MSNEETKKPKTKVKVVAIPKDKKDKFQKITQVKVVCCTEEEWTDHLSKIDGYSKAEDFSKVLKVIANPIRLKILLILLERDWACNCELETAFGEHQTLISHHLRNLRESGLITSNKKGQWKFYKIRDEARPFIENVKKLVHEIPLISE